jgi:trehalose 6-phosphate phosphatase
VATIDVSGLDAAVFDMDGVITDTARVHAAAWKRMFDAYLREVQGADAAPFTDADYREHVDGIPRYDGVDRFLRSRGVELPWGAPSDPPEAETVCGLGNRKNALFLEEVEAQGLDPYPTTIALVDELMARGLRTAVISSSKHATMVLTGAGVIDRFEHVVSGVEAAELGLPGKPAPDVFLRACDLLGVAPERSLVVEDALLGVEAGVAGGFALVIGVDRHGDGTAYRERGADLVVADLGEIELA